MSGEEQCREALGADLFAAVQAEMAPLPPSVDRVAVYEAIADGVQYLAVHRKLAPEVLRDQKDALVAVGRSIAKLKRKLCSPKPRGVREFGSGWWPGRDLERAYEALTKDYLTFGMTREDTDYWSPSKEEVLDQLIAAGVPTKDAVDQVNSKSSGRPPAVWRTATLARLRAAGVPATAAQGLLDAAGLVGGPTPEKVPPRI
jgi:hypothetical protein